MNPVLLACLKAGVITAPLYYVLWNMLFGSWEEFLNSLRYWFQPNWLSMMRGEYGEDLYASMKMFIFLGLCGIATFLVYITFFAPAL